MDANDHRADRVTGWWPPVLVVSIYAATAFVIPTLAPIAIWDDWAYAHSVRDLVMNGQLHFVDHVAVTLLSQTIWGAIFSFIFGFDLGILRLSTVILYGIGGLAFYGLCIELGAKRWWSSIGTLVYLFNPLAYLLSFTFMTEAPMISMMTISAYLFVRGLNRDDGSMIIAGSIAAAVGALIKQPVILMPLSLILYLFITRKIDRSRRGLSMILRVGGIPLLSLGIYYFWLSNFSRVPTVQSHLLEGMLDFTYPNIAFAIWGTLFRSALYAGLFVLPLFPILAALTFSRGREVPTWGWFAFVAVCFVVISEISIAWEGAGLILVGDPWIGPKGLGPPELIRGGRADLIGRGAFKAAVIMCAASAGVLAASLGRSFAKNRFGRAGAGIVAAFGAGQVLGALMPAMYYTAPWDRYLVPLSPFVIALGVWAVKEVKPRLVTALPCLLIAAFSFVSTRDFLVFEKAAWELAGRANSEDGVANIEMLSAAARDAYYLYGVPRPAGVPLPKQGYEPVWWVSFWELPNSGRYVIAADDFRGYEVVRRVEYSAWLRSEPQMLYLLHALPPDERKSEQARR